ncbi:MAG: 6,7-dimethyl-8-ribityllumazine synthase [Terracidiphilus sp.]|jgi:6,7-dimethyl-8-ribityllumazine synthase
MIKGISFLRPAGSAAAYDRLASFFSALGFAPGRGWEEETSHPNDEDQSLHPSEQTSLAGGPESLGTPTTSRGASFLAPLGNLEIVDGQFPSTADVLVEVTALDAAHQAAESWLRAQGGDSAAARLSPITETHWKSRIFTVEPEPGFAFSFWCWSDPLHGKPVAVEGDLSAAGMRFAIVVARWNAVITERLLEGALDALLRSGAKRNEIEVVRVPGAWEIPAAARAVANAGQVDAIVTLGCLLRGETAHFEAIYNEVARGIGQSQQETGIPHSFGVLTCETLEQALNRAGIKAGNKGFEAAVAAIEMVSLRRKLEQGRGPHVSRGGFVHGVEGGPA